jgi:hypothetical protein
VHVYDLPQVPILTYNKEMHMKDNDVMSKFVAFIKEQDKVSDSDLDVIEYEFGGFGDCPSTDRIVCDLHNDPCCPYKNGVLSDE